MTKHDLANTYRDIYNYTRTATQDNKKRKAYGEGEKEEIRKANEEDEIRKN